MDVKQVSKIFHLLILSLLFPVSSFAIDVKVAVFDGAKPFSYVDESGRASGIFPELLRSVFQGDEYNLQFITGLSFHDAYEQVLSGDIDILPTLVKTQERLKLFSFNKEVVLVSWSQVFLHPESSIESVLDLRDKKVALMKDGQNGKNFIELMKSFDIPFLPVYYPDFTHMTQDVLDKKVDAMVAFDGYIRTETRLKSSNILFSPNKAFYAVRKGGPEFLLDIIDNSVGKMKKNKNSLYFKEQKKLRFTDTVEVLPEWIYFLIAGFILCIFIVSLFILLLRQKVRKIGEKLHESEENYSRLFHAARDSIILSSFSSSSPHLVLDVNSSYCSRTGFSREEVLNLNINELGDEDQKPLFAQGRKKIETKGFSLLECRLKTKSGEAFPVEVSSQLFEKNSQKYVISIARDLSDREELKSALSAIEQKYSTIANYNFDWEVWKNDDGSFAYVSPSCERISGYSASEFMEDPQLLRNIIHPDDKEIWDDHIVVEQQESSDIKDLRIRIIRKDGETRWILHDSIRIPSSDGTSLGLRGNFRDVTERMALVEQLAQKQRLESLGVLSGGIAHDFNNILAIIKGFSEIAQFRFKDNDEVLGIFESINQASERAEDLTEQILDFSRNRKIQKKPVNMERIVKDVLKLIKPSFPSDIEILLNLESESSVLADEGQMHRVLVNLCTNARLAMAEGGRLSISLRELKDHEIPAFVENIGSPCLELIISDTGIGMTDDVKARVFDPFFTTRMAGEGTGLGLSVVHGLISDWGGQIRLESELGSGSSFFIYLPLIQSVVNKDERVENIEKSIETGLVLVMDDEQILLKLIGIYLDSMGYSSECYSKPQEGLEAFMHNPGAYTLAILDKTMPGMKGDQVALHLKKIRPDLPVILCSGFNDSFEEDHLPEGVDSFLQKPYTRDELIREITRVSTNGNLPL